MPRLTMPSRIALPRLAAFGFLLMLAFVSLPLRAQLHTQSLAGEWKIAFGEARNGTDTLTEEQAYRDAITLPATTETAGKGALLEERRINMLTPIRRVEGPVWYRREIVIPDAWSGLRVELFVERSKSSRVWLDSRFVGASDLFSAPQSFDLGSPSPGRHILTVCVDNSRRPIPGWGENHEITEHTQGNWNGLLGRIELRATGAFWLEDVQVDASPAAKGLGIRVRIGSLEEASWSGVAVQASVTDDKGATVASGSFPVSSAQLESALVIPSPSLWDEFDPRLYRLNLELIRNGVSSDRRALRFGFRDFRAKGKQFSINGRTLFLRGKHDGCVFPLTGHPPMEKSGWMEYFGILGQYGINHVRFHSWTPPEAAFEAADEMGLYLQPELPFWGTYNDAVKEAILPEGEAILRAYGNHPSFVMFSLGNENRGSRAVMAQIVGRFRSLDGRHLYAQGSNNFHWAPEIAPEDDYWTSGRLPSYEKGRLANVRGSFSTNDRDDGHVQVGPPSTTFDYASAISAVPMPVVGHEIGQYTVCPDYREIARYTGVFRAYNLEHFRDKARAAGLLARSDLFFRASGRLAAINYREEVETALRTPGFGGFQLLDLQDYPGQGTALVGLLNAFMESKGAISPEAWRLFCAPLVLLGRFESHAWSSGETARIDVELAHYGKDDLDVDTLEWRMEAADGATLVSGAIGTPSLKRGGLRPVARLDIPIPALAKALQSKLVLRLAKANVKNEYTFWLYPNGGATDAEVPQGVTLVRAFDEAAANTLTKGGTVFLMPDAEHPLARQVGGGFTTDFWCWPMFKNTPGTMGLACDPAHPALSLFPTSFHSDYQWFSIAMASQPAILDGLPNGLVPIVETIDNLERMHRLGLVFECKVGAGKLLVCAADLPALSETDKPAKQLLESLLAYLASPAFSPTCEVPPAALLHALRSRVPHGSVAASGSEPNRGPARAIDNNDGNSWDCPSREADAWWREDFPKPESFSAIELVLGKPATGYGYAIESSNDGVAWTLVARVRESGAEALQKIDAGAKDIAKLRIRFENLPAGGKASLAEVRLLR